MTAMYDELKIDDSFTAVIVRKVDNHLGPMGVVVQGVNGAGTQEFAAFHLDKDDLITLAKYWTEIAISIEYFIFCYSCFGCSDLRTRSFYWARVGRIRTLVGGEVDTAVDEVYRTFGEKQDKKTWETYLHGTKEERAALQDKIQEEIQRRMRDRDGD